MPSIIKASDHNTLVTSLNSLSTIEKKNAAKLATVTAGAIIKADSFAALQAAVNRLETSFSSNCCQSVNNNCCQSCQTCQSTSCQRSQCECNCCN